MRRICLSLLAFVFFVLSVHAQEAQKDISIPADSLAVYDSILQDIRLMLGTKDPGVSFLSLTVGAGNRLFSINNNSLNAMQSVTNKLVFTPTLAYNHKTGLGLSLTPFVTRDSGKVSFYQYAVSPSYTWLKNPKVAAGISYTHYFTANNNAAALYGTPVQDEIYGYLDARKGWLRPGIALGFAKGAYKETGYVDTAKYVHVLDTVYRIPVHLDDTIHTRVADLTVMGTVEHEMEWEHLFSKEDDLSVIPALSLVAGMQNYDVKAKYRAGFRSLLGKSRYRNFDNSRSENTGFQFQSVGFTLSISYFIGKFSISPQYFVNYYLQTTTTNRFSQIFMVYAGFLF